MIHPPHETGVEVLGAEELEESRLGVCVRYHEAGGERLPRFKHDPRRTVIRHHHARHPGAGANRGAGRGGRTREGLRQCAHAALRLRECGGACAPFGAEAAQQ